MAGLVEVRDDEPFAAAKRRFLKFVEIDPVTGCWRWKGWKNGKGYGRFHFEGGMRIASRIAISLWKGDRKINRRLVACHDCPHGDSPDCVCPDHLFGGTQKTNVRDMVGKGRHAAHKYPERWRVMIRRVNGSKLSQSIADQIRASTDSTSTLAARHQVNPRTIQRIKSGAYWPTQAALGPVACAGD